MLGCAAYSVEKGRARVKLESQRAHFNIQLGDYALAGSHVCHDVHHVSGGIAAPYISAAAFAGFTPSCAWWVLGYGRLPVHHPRQRRTQMLLQIQQLTAAIDAATQQVHSQLVTCRKLLQTPGPRNKASTADLDARRSTRVACRFASLVTRASMTDRGEARVESRPVSSLQRCRVQAAR